MKKLLKYDLSIMLHKKEFTIAFCAMMAFTVYALYSSIQFITDMGGESWNDYYLVSSELMSAMFVITKPWQTFTYLFAFIVVLPYSMSYIVDFETGVLTALLSRTNKTRYCLSKVITCFIGNVIIIFIPLLINYIFCKFTFSAKPNAGVLGEYGLSNFNNFVIGEKAISTLKYPVIPMAKLFVNNPSSYLLIHLVLISLASGIFGVFLICLSFIIKKYRALLFLPVFLLIRLSSALYQYCTNIALNDMSIELVNYSIMHYFGIGDPCSLSPYYLPSVFGVIILFCIVVIAYMANSDRLLFGEIKSDYKNSKK